MIRSENIFLPIYPVTPNHITQKGFPAKFCSIFALSARICRFSTAAFELEYFCLSARICRFWRSFYAESDTVIRASIDGFHQPRSVRYQRGVTRSNLWRN
jgi:hypothetical protein